jgi:hypothetical protein
MNRRTLAILAVIAATGCASRSPTDTNWAALGQSCPRDTPAFSLPEAKREVLPPDSHPTVNTQWAEIARRVPGGWGGYFIDGGTPTMYLTDPSKRSEALAGLREEGISLPSTTVVRRGRWDFAQLYDWYRYVGIDLVDGVSFADIDEASNRLDYGVIDEATRQSLEEALAALEIPCFLVAIEIRPYAQAATSAP